MDFIKNIYKSIDTEKNFMYRKNIKTRRKDVYKRQEWNDIYGPVIDQSI